MKNILILIAAILFFSSCITGGNAYKLNSHEKSNLKGYHANSAKKIIDKNEKNRDNNQKASEKNRKELNEKLSETHATSKTRKPKNNGVFKFY